MTNDAFNINTLLWVSFKHSLKEIKKLRIRNFRIIYLMILYHLRKLSQIMSLERKHASCHLVKSYSSCPYICLFTSWFALIILFFQKFWSKVIIRSSNILELVLTSLILRTDSKIYKYCFIVFIDKNIFRLYISMNNISTFVAISQGSY